MKRMIALVMLIALAPMAAGANVEFTKKPEVKVEGGKATVTFAVSKPTDVEVAVLDAKGKVVRHLAAGAVGAGAQHAVPLQAGLVQKLVWNGKDDLGKPATGKPLATAKPLGEAGFSIRVRAGLKTAFDGIIGDKRLMGPQMFGIATDDEGQVYVATGIGVKKNVPTIRVFDRMGKYLRTIMPFPPTLKAAEINGFGKARLRDGKLVPRQYDALCPILYPGGVTGFVGGKVQNGVLWLTNGRGQLCAIRAKDGACVKWGGGKSPAPPRQGPICWGVAPDGKTLYLAGWYYRRRKKDIVADGQIFKVDAATGERSKFAAIDVPPKSFWLTEPNGWYHYTNWGRKNGLSAVHGLAVDKAGNVYACDRVNQRISIYSPAGKLTGSIPVEWPDQVALGPKGDTVYVTTRRIVDGYKAVNEVKVLKISLPTKDKKSEVLAELALAGHNAPSVAIDASSDPAVIWLSNCAQAKPVKGRPPKIKGILRIEDKGDKFEVTGILNDDVPPLPTAIVKVWADPMSGDVITSNGWSGLSRFNGATGEATHFPLRGMDLSYGPKGNIYVYGQKGWHELVTKFTRDLKPGVFSGTGKKTTAMAATGKDVYGRYGHGWSNKGITVGPRGRTFVYNMYGWSKYYINVWDKTGKAEKHGRVDHSLVGPLDAQGGGVRVDFAGNIYVGMHGLPASLKLANRNTGAVVKFSPSGGGYVKRDFKKQNADGGIKWHGSQIGNFVEGGQVVYPYLVPQVDRGCVCKEARFDLDGYGRLYVPDAFDYCVRVYDNAGNLLATFGDYGNADTCGPDSAVPQPAIGLGSPVMVSVGHLDKAGRLYVADTLNARVVRVAVKYVVEETAPLE
jgi:SMP-30/gluconolaconase/LRE-like protein